MFKVGDIYRFRVIELGVESESSWQVIEVDGPLIKLFNPHDAQNTKIYNTGSLHFIGATLVKEGAGAEYWKHEGRLPLFAPPTAPSGS